MKNSILENKKIMLVIAAIAAVLVIVALILNAAKPQNQNSEIPSNEIPEELLSIADSIQNTTTQKPETTKAPEDEEIMQSFYDSSLRQILTTGEWVSRDGNFTLNFTEDTYTVRWNGVGIVKDETEAPVSSTYKYKILKIEVLSGIYKVTWEQTGLSGNLNGKPPGDVSTNRILAYDHGNNRYAIDGGCFEFNSVFYKEVEIVFEQPDLV